MNEREVVASLALEQVSGVGPISAKRLKEALGSAEAVFARRTELSRLIPGVSARIVESLADPTVFDRARRELEFALKHDIRCLCLGEPDYPSRMLECADAPLVLFYKGNVSLNRQHVINLVGTRHVTDYGRMLCTRLISELKEICPDVLIVSGLAYGVDICAHRAALESGLDTVGVLAHGLDRIYPSSHRADAIRMVDQGGLLTEFMSGTNPDRQNFVQRNRIIAGMSDATIVVESASKGGSLITAEIASGYGRECFAFPGLVGAPYSEGCNNLIRDNGATLLQNAEELVKAMGWESRMSREPVQQKLSFPQLTEEEQIVVDCLHRSPAGVHIDVLAVKTNMPVHKLSALLLNLEMQGVVRLLAGGNYRLLG